MHGNTKNLFISPFDMNEQYSRIAKVVVTGTELFRIHSTSPCFKSSESDYCSRLLDLLLSKGKYDKVDINIEESIDGFFPLLNSFHVTVNRQSKRRSGAKRAVFLTNLDHKKWNFL